MNFFFNLILVLDVFYKSLLLIEIEMSVNVKNEKIHF